MFDDLRDDDPPAGGDTAREAVRFREAALRARRGRRSLLAVGTVVAVAIGVIVVNARADHRSVRLQVGSVETTSTTSTSTSLPTDIDTECFGPLPTGAPSTAESRSIPDWPAGMPDLLMLGANGDVWVVHDGTASVWGHGYLWARAGSDGTVYASRLTGMAIDIDHLTGPGVVSATLRLPFTVKADAPAGSCPIDGYQPTFALTSDGLVLTRHLPGPIPHSCPYSPDTSDPWRCQSREEVTFDLRSTLDAPPDLSSIGVGLGGPARIVSDSTDTREFAYEQGDTVEYTLDNGPGVMTCCGGGALPGSAYALSPDGKTLASAYQGHTLSMPAGPSYITSDAITAMAWTGRTIAVAHGGRITLVPLDGGTPIDLDLVVGPITTLDWAS